MIPIDRRSLLSRLLPAIGVASAAAFYLVWEFAHRGVYSYSTTVYLFDDADEWRYTACSSLVLHGYRLFDQVFSAQPPLLFLSLASSMRVFGDSIDGARIIEIAFGLVGLLAVAWLAWSLGGPIAGAATALLLTVTPGYLVYAHMVEAEVPMMALASLSLALLTRVRGARGEVIWSACAGVCLAAAVLMKLFALEALLPGAWLIVSSRGHTEMPTRLRAGSMLPILLRRVRDAAPALASYIVVVAVIIGLDFALVSPLHQWQQVIDLHSSAASTPLPNTTPVFEIFRKFLLLDAGLTALAASGLVVLAFQKRVRECVFLVLWLIGGALMLLWFRPLFPHHESILLTSMAVSGGIAVAALWNCLSRRNVSASAGGVAGLVEEFGTSGPDNHGVRRAVFFLVGIPAVLYALLLPRLIHDDRHALYATSTTSDVLASFVAQHTRPQDFVVLDDLHAAVVANRLVPPLLCDPSRVRFAAGYLTAATAIDSTKQYQARLVLTTGVLSGMGEYQRWLMQHFARVRAPFRQHAYVR